jgi:hypothetical protein
MSANAMASHPRREAAIIAANSGEDKAGRSLAAPPAGRGPGWKAGGPSDMMAIRRHRPPARRMVEGALEMTPALLLLGLASIAEPPRCTLIYPVAPTQMAARRIAEAVIAARPHQPRQRYVLRVIPDQDDPGSWSAFQSLPEPTRRLPPGQIRVTAGGGGVEMRIDRCTGAVSRLFYVR